MFYRKSGYPEPHEIVLCTVTKILPHSVFARMDEYGKDGMIHISEISPGRIRNLRDYVKEGKKIVCKILQVNIEKGHIDLSLRRVNEGVRREKNDQIKQELKAEKIIEGIAKESKQDSRKLYDSVTARIFDKYEYLFESFNDVVAGELDIKEYGLDAKQAKVLKETILEKIKPPKVTIGGKLHIESYNEDGVGIVKEALVNIQAKDEKISIRYLGSGDYQILITSENFKEAEEILKGAVDEAVSFVESKQGEAEFKKTVSKAN